MLPRAGRSHPRRHVWSDHFEWQGVFIVGKTATGRTTVEVLDLNSDDQLQLRIELQFS